MFQIYRKDVNVEVDFRIFAPTTGIFLGARVSKGGCDTQYADGVFSWIYPHNNSAVITGNFSKFMLFIVNRMYILPLGYERVYLPLCKV